MEEETPKVEEEVEDAIDALREEDVEGEHFESEDETAEETEEEPKEESLEDIASEYGWNRNFKGETKLTAAEFLRKGEDIRISTRKSLKEQKRKLDSMESALTDIKHHYAANTEAQTIRHKKQIDSLRKKRIEAIEEGDPERVDEIEGEMYDIYNTPQPRKSAPKAPQADPEEVAFFNGWRDANPWYAPTGKGGDMDMTQYADEQAAELERYADLPYERKLEIVTKRVEKKFSKSPRPSIPSVEGPRLGRAKKQFSVSALNNEERTVMKSLVKNKVLTQAEYMRDWAKQREA